jgi:hypothetical protein
VANPNCTIRNPPLFLPLGANERPGNLQRQTVSDASKGWTSFVRRPEADEGPFFEGETDADLGESRALPEQERSVKEITFDPSYNQLI